MHVVLNYFIFINIKWSVWFSLLEIWYNLNPKTISELNPETESCLIFSTLRYCDVTVYYIYFNHWWFYLIFSKYEFARYTRKSILHNHEQLSQKIKLLLLSTSFCLCYLRHLSCWDHQGTQIILTVLDIIYEILNLSEIRKNKFENNSI